MTKIKLCGLTKTCEIETANELLPEYIGFVFAPKSRRYLAPEHAAVLRETLHPDISAVGVFVDAPMETVASLLRLGIIDMAQLHGNEDEAYITKLRTLTDHRIIKAFRMDTRRDAIDAATSTADYVLLDSGGGTGRAFDWKLIPHITRPYFLAGGLGVDNVKAAVEQLAPYAVDVSSGIETDGRKDKTKMREFVHAVRSARRKEEKS